MYRLVFSNDAVGSDDSALALKRVKRLQKVPNNLCAAIVTDLLRGAGPWILGVCLATTGLWQIHERVDGAEGVFEELGSPTAVATISTFSAFLLVSKIQANLACNSTIIKEFNNLSGALINLALWIKSQKVENKRALQMLTLPDGRGGFYNTNRIGMTLASVPYIVKYTGRKKAIDPEGLPLGQVDGLLERFKYYTSNDRPGASPPMTPFLAAVLLIGEQIDQIQSTEKKDTEYSVLFAQLNAVTAAEGAIGATSGYDPPYLLDALLYALAILYLSLVVVSDLIPNNGANAIWIAAVIALCTIVFFQISDLYWNPMQLSRKKSGQKPLIADMCITTERAINEIFSSNNPAEVPLSTTREHSARFRMRLGDRTTFVREAGR